MDFVNFTLSDFWLEKAKGEIAYLEREERRKQAQPRHQSAKGKPQSLQLNVDGKDAEGRSRRKAHSNLSPEEKAERKRQQDAKRAERIAKDKEIRAKMQGSSNKKI